MTAQNYSFKENLFNFIIPGISGNVLEWYDFCLYGYFASEFARLFFPAQTPVLSLLAAFGTFACGYFMRPLGAIVFGYLGDRIGRKQVLIFAVLLMVIPTVLMGCLPTYDQIGPIAGVLLVLCRLVQGFSLGGSFTGSMVYVIEHVPSTLRGFYGSTATWGAYAGFLVASIVGVITNALFAHSAYPELAWRMPFLLGLILGGVALYIRLHMKETPHFVELANSKQIVANPIGYIFQHFPKLITKAMLLPLLPAVGFYIVSVYLPAYLNTFLQIPLQTGLEINTVTMVIILIAMPLLGYLSDHIGRKPLFFIAGGGMLVLAYPLFLLIGHGSWMAIFIGQLVLFLCVVCADANIPATLAEMVPTNVRYTSMSIAYSVAMGVFGGTAPLLVTLLIHHTHNILSPAFYLMLCGAITVLLLFTLPETAKKSLD
jgi:MHS family proline/betaine transporter-like MFS transporter